MACCAKGTLSQRPCDDQGQGARWQVPFLEAERAESTAHTTPVQRATMLAARS